MSPSWRNRVLIGLAPERLTALALGGVMQPRLLDRHAVSLHEQPGAAWEAGVAALQTLLAEAPWRGRLITVILSSHYVRHAIVPPASGLSESEQQALAAAVFKEVFGDLAGDWELRVSPSRRGSGSLACGVSRPLLAALRSVCGESGRLHSIQPGLMPVFNSVQGRIGKSVACLALVEPGRVTLASVANGQWQYIDSRAGNGHTLPQLLLEEGELHERPPGGILWLCDLAGATRLPADSFWSCRPIPPPRLTGVEDISSLAVWGLA